MTPPTESPSAPRGGGRRSAATAVPRAEPGTAQEPMDDALHEQRGRDERESPSGPPSRVKRAMRTVDHFQRRRRPLSFPFAVVKKFGEDDAGSLAALVAYYGFFSIFPLLLAMTSVLGFVLRGDEDLQRRIVDSTVAQLPVVGRQISENVGSLHGSTVAVVLGLAGALWAGLGVVQAMQKAMNSVWDVPMRERPNALESRLRALVTLVVFGLAMIVTTLGVSISTAAQTIEPFDAIVAAVVSVLINSLIYLMAFKVLTDRPLGWRELLPGAVVGGVAFTVLQLVGGALVGRNVRGASDTYGTFAVVIGLLAWLYLLAQVSVAAAEVNVVAARRLWPRALLADDLTDADHRALRQHADVEERVEQEKVAVQIQDGSDDTSDREAADRETADGETADRETADREAEERGGGVAERHASRDHGSVGKRRLRLSGRAPG